MISVKCPHCHVGLKVDEGKIPLDITSFKCPKCRQPIPVSLLSMEKGSVASESETVLIQPLRMTTGRLSVIANADTPEQTFPLQEGVYIIGRKSNASTATIGIITADKSMSREHIRIEVKKHAKGGYKHYLSDNNSKNHTLYNSNYLENGEVVVLYNNDEIIIGTSCGMAIRFAIEDLRPLGRSARGVNSMKLRTGDTIIGCDVVPRDYDADLLVVTSDGFGKRSKLSEFRPQNRGGLGLIATKFKSAASRLVALTIVDEHDDIMVVTANGIVTRVSAADISRQGRPATGVKVQNLVDGDTVVSVNKIINPDEDESVQKEPQAVNAEDSEATQGNLNLE